jgi:hypothetical protein
MKLFSEKVELISAILAFLGFTLIGLTTKLTIIGILLFVPITFVQLHTHMVKNNLKYFNYPDSLKIFKALFKGEII